MFNFPLGEAALYFHAVAVMLEARRQVTDHLVLALDRLLVRSQQLPQYFQVIRQPGPLTHVSATTLSHNSSLACFFQGSHSFTDKKSRTYPGPP